eukprot:2478080-Pyramimonas_sp.AAC.2
MSGCQQVELDLVLGLALAPFLTHVPAPRVPGCGEVVTSLGLQPLQVGGRRLAWASRPAGTAVFPGA